MNAIVIRSLICLLLCAPVACSNFKGSISGFSGSIQNNLIGQSICNLFSYLIVPVTSGSVSTIAGCDGGSGNTDGTSLNARFSMPYGITTDGTNLYVVDTSNNTIRKIVIATGVVTTLAGTAGVSGSADGTGAAANFKSANGIATDGANLYVADTGNNTIRKIVIATGVVTTLAGTAGVSGSVDGTGAAASFNYPSKISTDGTNLYVSDSANYLIRKIVIATRVVTTLAGTVGAAGSVDGTSTAASFGYPWGSTTDGTNLYVADEGNGTIRKIVIATGAVTTLAGTAGVSGSADGTGAAASFNSPIDISSDGTNLYVADKDNQTIRQIVIATGVVTTLAGTTGTRGAADGTGTAVEFSRPFGLAYSGSTVYVADTFNNTIRQIDLATKAVTTTAGLASITGSADGTGINATFKGLLSSMTTDGTNIYVTDTDNNTIRKVTPAGVVTTVAGTAGVSGSADGTGTAAQFYEPCGITTDGTNLYVADNQNNTIRQIVIATGVVTTLAGTAGVHGSADGTGAAARFYLPWSIATDGTNLYVADSVNRTIRQIVIATGVVTTLAGTAGASGDTDGTGAAARFMQPWGVATDGTNLYVSDNNTIRQIVISTAVVTTLAGTPGVQGYADGTGTSAIFHAIFGIATDGTNLYVADPGNYLIRKIVIATGVVTTLLGQAGQNGSVNGSTTQAQLSTPYGIVLLNGHLYFSGAYNIREMQ